MMIRIKRLTTRYGEQGFPWYMKQLKMQLRFIIPKDFIFH